MKINVIQILICLFCMTNTVAQKQQNVLMIVLDDLNDFTGVLKGHPPSSYTKYRSFSQRRGFIHKCS